MVAVRVTRFHWLPGTLELIPRFFHKCPVRYRLLIFDFDGTLADTFPAFLEHMRQTMEHFGLRTIDAQTLDELRGRGAREIIARLGIPAWKVPLLARYMRKLMAVDARQTRLFPGAVDMLRRLADRGQILAIVSSNAEANIRAVLGEQDSALITTFACGASLFGKAAKFRRVLKSTGLAASDALSVGDEIRDLESAREAGIDFGAVAWGYTKIEALQSRSPAAMLHTFEDLLHLCGPLPKS